MKKKCMKKNKPLAPSRDFPLNLNANCFKYMSVYVGWSSFACVYTRVTIGWLWTVYVYIYVYVCMYVYVWLHIQKP